MCGFVGVASKNNQSKRDWLIKARDTLIHRGPNDEGVIWSNSGRVGLAFRRLSIIDLSKAGHQPMQSEDRSLSIVFNGEIYNFKEVREDLVKIGHKFKSNSDTEVLLASYQEWGVQCVKYFQGMFAFAIYDSILETIFLARDRAGEKPLFYYFKNGIIYFSSELKALLSNSEMPRKIDPESLDCYLAMGYVPGSLCILKGYNKLRAAEGLIFDIKKGTIKKWKYWKLPEFQNNRNYPNNKPILELSKKLEGLLEDSVKKQLVSDVPLGVLLSGGVDSSLITALAAKHSPSIKTFSIGFPNSQNHDETRHARLISDYFKTEHTELYAEPADAEMVSNLAYNFDEPVIDSSMIPTWLVSNLVSKYCTVALGGDGGDELFGGYGHYSRLIWMKSYSRFLPSFIRNVISKSASRILPVGFKGRNWLQALESDLNNSLPLIANYFDKNSRSRLLSEISKVSLIAEDIFKNKIPINKDLLQRATRMDFNNYLVEDILVKVDRASMSNSLEIRAPFLDYKLIEFAFGEVPAFMKANSKSKKIILKTLCDRLLPKNFDKKRKQGFGIPINSWLKSGTFRDLFWDQLTDNDTIFNKKYLERLLLGQDKGYNNGEKLFGLVLFEIWRKKFKVTF